MFYSSLIYGDHFEDVLKVVVVVVIIIIVVVVVAVAVVVVVVVVVAVTVIIVIVAAVTVMAIVVVVAVVVVVVMAVVTSSVILEGRKLTWTSRTSSSSPIRGPRGHDVAKKVIPERLNSEDLFGTLLFGKKSPPQENFFCITTSLPLTRTRWV